MPGAIGWAPTLLPSTGGVIAQPKVQSRNSDSARCDWEIEEVAEAALLPVARTLRSGKLNRPVKYKRFRRSNILAIRVADHLRYAAASLHLEFSSDDAYIVQHQRRTGYDSLSINRLSRLFARAETLSVSA